MSEEEKDAIMAKFVESMHAACIGIMPPVGSFIGITPLITTKGVPEKVSGCQEAPPPPLPVPDISYENSVRTAVQSLALALLCVTDGDIEEQRLEASLRMWRSALRAPEAPLQRERVSTTEEEWETTRSRCNTTEFGGVSVGRLLTITLRACVWAAARRGPSCWRMVLDATEMSHMTKSGHDAIFVAVSFDICQSLCRGCTIIAECLSPPSLCRGCTWPSSARHRHRPRPTSTHPS